METRGGNWSKYISVNDALTRKLAKFATSVVRKFVIVLE